MEDSVTSQDDYTLEALTAAVRRFEESEDATTEARAAAERDRDYYDEKQWTAAEKAALEKRGQPAVTFNRVKRKINALTGIEKQTRKDPRAFPRNPSDDDSAQAATDAIRYVCEDSRWDDKRSEAAKELAIEGTCAIMVGVKPVKGGVDPEIRRIAWDRFYYDPHATEFDFADACYMGVVVWMDLDKAKAKYPGSEDVLIETWRQAQQSETYDDKPKHRLWADYRRRRVRICEEYYLDGEGWKFCMFTKAGFIVPPMPSPYIGEDGAPECPIKAVSLYIDRDNNRYGEVRTMIGPQDEINKRRSKALHLINSRQVRVSNNVQMDAQAVRRELSKPDGVFVGEAGEVEILPTQDMASANLAMLQEAKNEIDLLGPNAALGGKAEGQMSGRAILAQQQGGMTEAATYLDRIRALSIAVYRSVWARIRQVWTGERWVRVTDNERNLRFVGLNQPVTMLQAMAKEMGITKDALPQIQQAAQAGDPQAIQALQQLQAMAADPRASMVVGVENAVAELDVDILADEGLDAPTIAAEEFEQLIKLASTGIVPIPPDVLIEASSLRNKPKLLEMLRQGPSQEQVMAQQIALAGEQAKVAETESKTVLNEARAQETLASIQTNALQVGIRAGMA